MPMPNPSGEDADYGELEDADVRRRRRDDGGHVDCEENRRGSADPTVWSSPRAMKNAQHAPSWIAHAGKLGPRGSDPEARPAVDGQPRLDLEQSAVGGVRNAGEAAVAVSAHQHRRQQNAG